MIKIVKIISRNIIFFFKGTHIGFIDKFRLKLGKRFKVGTVSLSGIKIKYTDAPAFVSMYEEIFIREIYRFNPASHAPIVIDGGANIGLGIIYIKLLFPEAIIDAFEPDPEIFKILEGNIKSFGFKHVNLHQKALWINDDVLTFASQGGLSGQISVNTSVKNSIQVPAFRLKNMLHQKVDLLKIDIEGAEYSVVNDCKDVLHNASFFFLEYHSDQREKQKLDEILSLITHAGFRYYIQEAFTSPQPFVEVKTMLDMDLQLNIFCIK